MRTLDDPALWQRILRAEEGNLVYFAVRSELPGVALFVCERGDAPEFDLAVVYRVEEADAGATLREIVRHYRTRGRRPRVRLTPLSTPGDWPDRLARAGFAETDERQVVYAVPDSVHLVADSAVEVRRVEWPEEADRFSAIQGVGFELSAAHRAWDRALTRRHLVAGSRRYYLASLDGATVGAAASVHYAGGLAGLYGLTTLPEARGRGVATSLLRRRIAEARAAGCDLIFGTAHPASYALGFYERLGFVRLFETRTYAQECQAAD